MAIIEREEMNRLEERAFGGPVPQSENSQCLTPSTPIVPYIHISSTTTTTISYQGHPPTLVNPESRRLSTQRCHNNPHRSCSPCHHRSRSPAHPTPSPVLAPAYVPALPPLPPPPQQGTSTTDEPTPKTRRVYGGRRSNRRGRNWALTFASGTGVHAFPITDTQYHVYRPGGGWGVCKGLQRSSEVEVVSVRGLCTAEETAEENDNGESG